MTLNYAATMDDGCLLKFKDFEIGRNIHSCIMGFDQPYSIWHGISKIKKKRHQDDQSKGLLAQLQVDCTTRAFVVKVLTKNFKFFFFIFSCKTFFYHV